MDEFSLSVRGWRLTLLSVLLPLMVRAGIPIAIGVEPSSVAAIGAVAGDADGDGVPDNYDLCPATPAGTPVNAYGCPKTVATCTYNAASFTLSSSGGSGNGIVRYVLADSVGKILQVNTTPSFNGLTGSHTYMALAVTYSGSILNLVVGNTLSNVTTTCFDWSDALIVKVCVANTPPQPPTDSDGDGVPDTKDLCPGTPAGTLVNTYGCPVSLAACTYTGSSFTLTNSGGSGNGIVRYVLADSVGKILQVNTTPSFTGLTGSHTYMALSIIHDGSVLGLSVGQSLSAVTAACFDWSDAVVVKVCMASQPVCEYTTGAMITLSATGGSTGAGIQTQYALVNSAGLIVRLNTIPSFSTTGLVAGTYTAYAVVFNDDGSTANLQTGKLFTTVQAKCIAISAGRTLTLCADCSTRTECVPLVVKVNRRIQ